MSRLKDLRLSLCCSLIGEARVRLFLTGEVDLEGRELVSGSGGSSKFSCGRALVTAANTGNGFYQ